MHAVRLCSFALVLVLALAGPEARAQLRFDPDAGEAAPLGGDIRIPTQAELRAERMRNAADFLMTLSADEFDPYLNDPQPCSHGPLVGQYCFELDNPTMVEVVRGVSERRRNARADEVLAEQTDLAATANQWAFWALVVSVVGIVVTVLLAVRHRGKRPQTVSSTAEPAPPPVEPAAGATVAGATLRKRRDTRATPP